MEMSERHKLDNVSGGCLPRGGQQQFVVAVQKLHGAEVRAAHAHYDDGHGQTGRRHDGGACLVHVCDHTVCEDEQHKVLLRMDRNKGTGQR